jgi:hypothetical protein
MLKYPKTNVIQGLESTFFAAADKMGLNYTSKGDLHADL